jgi:hypothetical protein
MKSKTLTSAVRAVSILLLASATCALGQDRRPTHFSGLINDYTPSTVKGGPWEMHGQWTLDLRPDWRAASGFVADFSADMTMSDYGTTVGLPDATKGGQRLSDQRHGQPYHGKWNDRSLREPRRSAPFDAAGLHHRGGPGAVFDYEFEHFAGLWRTRNQPFRHPSHSRRCAQRDSRPKHERSRRAPVKGSSLHGE